MHETGVGGQGDHPAVDHFLPAFIFDVVVGKRMHGIVDDHLGAKGEGMGASTRPGRRSNDVSRLATSRWINRRGGSP